MLQLVWKRGQHNYFYMYWSCLEAHIKKKIPNSICLRRRKLWDWDIGVKEIFSTYVSWIPDQWRWDYVTYFDNFLINDYTTFLSASSGILFGITTKATGKEISLLTTHLSGPKFKTQFITFAKHAFSICGISFIPFSEPGMCKHFFSPSGPSTTCYWILPFLPCYPHGYLGAHF